MNHFSVNKQSERKAAFPRCECDQSERCYVRRAIDYGHFRIAFQPVINGFCFAESVMLNNIEATGIQATNTQLVQSNHHMQYFDCRRTFLISLIMHCRRFDYAKRFFCKAKFGIGVPPVLTSPTMLTVLANSVYKTLRLQCVIKGSPQLK